MKQNKSQQFFFLKTQLLNLDSYPNSISLSRLKDSCSNIDLCHAGILWCPVTRIHLKRIQKVQLQGSQEHGLNRVTQLLSEHMFSEPELSQQPESTRWQ